MFLCSDELFVVQKGKGGGSSNLLALPATIRTRKRVRAFMNLSRSSWAIILRGPTASPLCCQLCRIAFIPKLADPDSPCVNSSGTSIAKTYGGPMTYGQSARAPTLAKMSQAFRSLVLHADAPPQATQEGEMIESLAQMPTDTMIFLTMAVLGLAVMLIVLSRLI